jgi:diguanylate cyclase (GGDEF)-like protein
VQHLLKQLTSQRGRAYRYGGEEFLVILPNHNTDEAIQYGEKLRIAFETHNFDIDGIEEKITILVGISLWPHHGKEYKEVLNAANIAEHKAKDSGRNSVVLAAQA